MALVAKMAGTYLGWKRVEYADNDGVVQVSQRLRILTAGDEHLGEDTTVEYLLRVQDGLEIPQLKMAQAVKVAVDFRQSSDGKLWFATVLEVQAV